MVTTMVSSSQIKSWSCWILCSVPPSARRWTSMRCSLPLCLVEVPLMQYSLFASCRGNILPPPTSSGLRQPWKSLWSCGKKGPMVGTRGMGVEEWAVLVIQGIYHNARSHVWVNGQCIEEFGVGVGVHQGSVLSLLLFILVLEELSHKFRTGVPWELRFVYYLVLIADTQEGLISKLKAWKAGMESKGLPVNMKKTKFMVCWPWCSKEIRQVSLCCLLLGCQQQLDCSKCKLWVHKKSSGITKQLEADANYIYPR